MRDYPQQLGEEGNPPEGPGGGNPFGEGGGRDRPAGGGLPVGGGGENLLPNSQHPQEGKPMGQLPPIFDGDRKLVESFIDCLKAYFCLNHQVPAF